MQRGMLRGMLRYKKARASGVEPTSYASPACLTTALSVCEQLPWQPVRQKSQPLFIFLLIGDSQCETILKLAFGLCAQGQKEKIERQCAYLIPGILRPR